MKSNHVACGSIRPLALAVRSLAEPEQHDRHDEHREPERERDRVQVQRRAIAMNTSANSAMVLPSSRNDRPRDGLPVARARDQAARRCAPAARSRRRRARAPAPAASAPRAPQSTPARRGEQRRQDQVDALNSRQHRRLRFVRRSRGRPRELALVRLHDAHERLDGGAETEEESEVHDPVCVELAVEVGSRPRRRSRNRGRFRFRGRRPDPPSATCFCCPGRWRGVRLTRPTPKIKRSVRPGRLGLLGLQRPARRGPRGRRWRRTACPPSCARARGSRPRTGRAAA